MDFSMATHTSVILSDEELMAYRNKPKTLPARSCKNVETANRDMQKFHNDLHEVFNEERTQKQGDLSTAVYHSKTGLIELTEKTGKFLQHMGYFTNCKTFLYPEEAIFLMESSQLELYNNNLPMTIQDAYQLLLNTDCNFEQYQAYCQLTRVGYRLVRHRDEQTKIRIESKSRQQFHKEYEFLLRKRSHDDEELSGLPNKKMRLNDVGAEYIDFPSCCGDTYFFCRIPPQNLLPPNVAVTLQMCAKNLQQIKDDKNPKGISSRRRPQSPPDDYPKYFPNGIHAESWLEFKKELNKINSGFNHFEKTQPAAAQPHSTENLINAEEPLEKEPEIKLSDSKIHYDVYLPPQKNVKQESQTPKHKLTVTNARESRANLHEICKMGKNDGVSLLFAVNDCGPMAFYTMNRISIPDLN